MKAEEILKSITPEVKKRETEKIQKIKLPAELQKWVKEYEKAGGERDKKIWLFVYKIIKDFFPFVACDKQYSKSLNETKFLFTMFVIIIDDIADKKKDEELLNEIFKLIFYDNYTKSKDLEKLPLFVLYIIEHIKREIKKYPFFEDFKELFYFEIIQIFNSMKFAVLVDKYPFVINKIDYRAYFPCTMQVMAYGMLELMCTPNKLSLKELTEIRSFFSVVQNMTRIGNWISTWEREIYEEDFTSLIFAYAIDYNITDVSDLKRNNKSKIIRKIKESNIEKKLIEEWKDYYQEICNNKKTKKKWINTEDFLTKIEKLLVLQVATKS